MLDQPVRLHTLSFVPERDEVLVGRRNTESYSVFPADGAALLQRMTEGMTPEQAGSWYEATYGERVDLDDFLVTLTELGFLRSPDGLRNLAGPAGPDGQDDAQGHEPAADEQVGLRWLGRALFGPAAWLAYFSVIALWAIVVSRHPGLAPHPGQIFFVDSLLLVQLVLVFGQVPWIFLHEAYHVLAGRRLGLPSELGFGTRLYFVVFETRMNGLLTVHRRRRYLPFLAGIVLDVQLICGLGLLSFALGGASAHPSFLSKLLLALAFPVIPRLAYQFLLFLQTDVYFVFATALGCYDLHAATRALVLNRIWRRLGRPDRVVDESQWTDRDRQVARWYAPFAVVGVGVLLAVTALVLAPICVRFITLVGRGLTSDRLDPRFWDTAASVAFNVLQIALFVAVAWRNRTRSRKDQS
jgi:hypothetical protein